MKKYLKILFYLVIFLLLIYAIIRWFRRSSNVEDVCWDVEYVEYQGCKVVSKGGKYGVLDSRGNLIVPCEYTGVEYFLDYIKVYDDTGLEGLYDRSGNLIIPLKYSYISNEKYGDVYMPVMSTEGLFGIFDLIKRQLVVECNYNYITSQPIGGLVVQDPYYNSTFVGRKNDKYDLINQGLIVLEGCKNLIWFANHRLLAVCDSEDVWRLVYPTGREVSSSESKRVSFQPYGYIFSRESWALAVYNQMGVEIPTKGYESFRVVSPNLGYAKYKSYSPSGDGAYDEEFCADWYDLETGTVLATFRGDKYRLSYSSDQLRREGQNVLWYNGSAIEYYDLEGNFLRLSPITEWGDVIAHTKNGNVVSRYGLEKYYITTSIGEKLSSEYLRIMTNRHDVISVDDAYTFFSAKNNSGYWGIVDYNGNEVSDFVYTGGGAPCSQYSRCMILTQNEYPVVYMTNEDGTEIYELIPGGKYTSIRVQDYGQPHSEITFTCSNDKEYQQLNSYGQLISEWVYVPNLY